MHNQTVHIAGPQINQFNNISPRPVPRSSFNRSFTRRSTFNQNNLVPIFLDEILPGDDINVNMTSIIRVATALKTPFMDNIYADSFWFFVPNRLLWTNWEKFQGAQTNPGDSVAYTIPVLDRTKTPLSSTGFQVGSIHDYFGLPINVSASDPAGALSHVSSLWNRAYDLIWNQWFRDEDLQNSIAVPTGDGPDDPGLYVLRDRNKAKDYFTSGRPWPQKGTASNIPLGTFAPVIPTGQNMEMISSNDGVLRGLLGQASSNAGAFSGAAIASTSPMQWGVQTGLQVDLAAASTVTINALRQAALYQQILELDARGGTRYIESIYSRFGVVNPDYRLQRPELIGQGSTRIDVFAVPQTAPTGLGDTPQGNLAAFATGRIQDSHGCKYAATEHGVVIGMINIRADITYFQGVPKMFTRRTRLDFYEPLQNGLGEQAVLNGEIYAQGTATDAAAFCYQERFSEYRFKQSEITGYFRSTAPTPLDFWGLWQDFGTLPTLNSQFITQAVPMERVVADPGDNIFLMDASFNYNHVRPMPIRSNPGIDIL